MHTRGCDGRIGRRRLAPARHSVLVQHVAAIRGKVLQVEAGWHQPELPAANDVAIPLLACSREL